MQYHLAQANIGKIRASLDDPLMVGFVSQLEAVNAIADNAPGFVWRLQDNSGNATHVRPFADDQVLVNLSVWESIEAFANFVYHGQHAKVMRDRYRWFEKTNQAMLVLWWIPAGSIPTVQDIKERLDHLRLEGSTPYAFSFAKPFPPQSNHLYQINS
jgi:heme-degrading monooxygenase HmoA